MLVCDMISIVQLSIVASYIMLGTVMHAEDLSWEVATISNILPETNPLLLHLLCLTWNQDNTAWEFRVSRVMFATIGECRESYELQAKYNHVRG